VWKCRSRGAFIILVHFPMFLESVSLQHWKLLFSCPSCIHKNLASGAVKSFSPVGNTFTSENALSGFIAGERNPWLCRALHLLVGRCNALLPGLSTIYNRQFKYDNFCVKLCGARPLGILHRVASCVTKSCYEHAVECYRELLWASLLGVTESCYGQVC
jgi:hypothetical protein